MDFIQALTYPVPKTFKRRFTGHFKAHGAFAVVRSFGEEV